MDKDASRALHGVEKDLTHHNVHSERYPGVMDTVNQLRRQDPNHLQRDLSEINKGLTKANILPELTLTNTKDDLQKVQLTEKTMSRNGKTEETKVLDQSKPDIPKTDRVTSAASDHKALINEALGLNGLKPTKANEDSINTIVTGESHWVKNPGTIHDINWAQGNASEGLMQITGSNFHEYHIGGTSNNIEDPLANMAAAVNYIKHTYGTPENVPGVRSQGQLRITNGPGPTTPAYRPY